MSRTPEEVKPSKRPATYEDLLRVPDHKIAEIVDGELCVSPMPGSWESYCGSRAVFSLSPFNEGFDGPGGWWFLPRTEWHVGGDVLVPDMLGWRQSRLPRMLSVPFMTLVPDWIFEVRSEATKEVDRKKLRIYACEGVRYVWLADPHARTLDILRCESGDWVKVAGYQGDAIIRPEPFEALPYHLGRLWVTPERDS